MPERELTEVVIVGAGVAGLSCARMLHDQGISFTIVERSDRVGGRIRTDRLGGYQLDRGFQVVQTGYPDLTRYLNLKELNGGLFPSGVAVQFDRKFHVIADPRRHPKYIYSTLFSPVGTLADRFRMLKLAWTLSRESMEKIFVDPEHPTGDFLKDKGFSEAFIQRFLTPFFAGACLDRSMAGSSRVFKYVTRLFATGDAVLPAAGMSAVAEQLASVLPTGSIKYRSEATKVESGKVALSDGSVMEADNIVVAVPEQEYSELIAIELPRRSVGEACVYFSSDWRPPLEVPFLILNGEGEGPINNIAFPSLVSPDYAPAGETLIAVVVLGDEFLQAEDLEDQVLQQCREWFGPAVDRWQHLRTYRIPHALPAQSPPTLSPYQEPTSPLPGVIVCGEYGSLPGLLWSLMSGAMAGERVANDRRKR